MADTWIAEVQGGCRAPFRWRCPVCQGNEVIAKQLSAGAGETRAARLSRDGRNREGRPNGARVILRR